MHVMWSRSGLEEWVGDRGALFPALGMSETANFQSNLDGRRVDVCRELLEVLHDGEESVKHPVNGVVTCCDMVHHKLVP